MEFGALTVLVWMHRNAKQLKYTFLIFSIELLRISLKGVWRVDFIISSNIQHMTFVLKN